MCTLLYSFGWMITHTTDLEVSYLVNWNSLQTKQHAESLQLGKNVNMSSFALEEVRH